MKKEGYYSVSQFMKLAHITKKTVRYYDEHNILKPAYVDPEHGARFYTDANLAQLQQILLLKTLGFSLSDIKELTIQSSDSIFMKDSLTLQQKLIDDRIQQMQIISQAIQETSQLIEEKKEVDWSHMLELISHLGMETSMKNQYQNASNISSRINLHALYTNNKIGWFPWIYSQCHFKAGMNVLELGCGDGSFWRENMGNDRKDFPHHLLPNMEIVLSDISEGMLLDTQRSLQISSSKVSYKIFGCENIPYKDNFFDVILANHVLFYCDDINKALKEIQRVLKPDGRFLCSTYGKNHMKEISEMVVAFDDRIVLSAHKLYTHFGKENGTKQLQKHFSYVEWVPYEDYLLVSDPEPIISYVLSCHGNQNQYILDHYKEFRNHVKEYTKKGFRITKEAGLFLCH